MKFRDMSTEMTEQEIITALYMICPDSLYKRYKRENKATSKYIHT